MLHLLADVVDAALVLLGVSAAILLPQSVHPLALFGHLSLPAFSILHKHPYHLGEIGELRQGVYPWSVDRRWEFPRRELLAATDPLACR